MSRFNWSHPEYETIVRLMSARTGLAFRPDQRDATEMGIQRAMKRSRVTDLARFAELLHYDMQALNDLIVELTVGETYFFREPRQFAHLRHKLIPEIRRRRGADHTIRFWCAACASGEEAYSLAILCDQEGIGESSHILATDISEAALAKAREASYREWSLRGDGAATAKKYLTPISGRYHVEPRIVRRVQFDFLNLALDIYPSYATGTKGLDLILCRNVLIYFDRETVRAVAGRLFDSLSDGGWLITASGDPPLDGLAAFEAVVTDDGVFYRRPVATPESVLESVQECQAAIAAGLHLADDTVALEADDDTVVPRRKSPSLNQRETTPLPSPAGGGDRLREARAALDRGHYGRVVELTEGQSSDPAACVLQLKALSNIDTRRAVEQCAQFVQQHPLSAELQYLHAVLLMEMNLDVEAAQAVQRAVFLDRSLAAGHFLLGSILQRRGALDGARRHFRNARNLCQSRPRDERVALADSETAEGLAAAAQSRLVIIEAAMK